MEIYYFFFLSFLTNIQCFIVLSQSNASTIIINPITNVTTYASPYQYYFLGQIPQAPNAISISEETIRFQCNSTMTIQSIFQIRRCVLSTLYAHIAGDGRYIAYLNGEILRNGSIQSMDDFMIDSTNFKCGIDINLTIIVLKDLQCDDRLAVKYAIVSDDCVSCNKQQIKCCDSYFYDNTLCKCKLCNLTLENCVNCIDGISCLSCVNGYRVNKQTKLCEKNIQISLLNDLTKGIIIGFSVLILIIIIIAICYLIYTRNRVIYKVNQQKPRQQINSCIICLENGCDLMTSCNHRFHSKCLRQWVIKTPQCPTCRNKNIEVVKVFICMKCQEICQNFQIFKESFLSDIELQIKKMAEVHQCKENRNNMVNASIQNLKKDLEQH